MKPYLFLLLFVLLLSCGRDYNTITNASELAPQDADIVFSLNQPVDLGQALSKQPFQSNINHGLLSQIKNVLEQLQPQNELVITIHSEASEKRYNIITKFHNNLIQKDSLNTTTNSKQNTATIKTLVAENDTIYYSIHKNFFIGSNKKRSIALIKEQTTNNRISQLLKASDDSKPMSVFYKEVPQIFLLHKDEEKLTDYSTIDITPQSNNFQFSGITKAEDSSYYINAFKNTIPQALKLSEIAPQNTLALQRIAFDDYSSFTTQLSEINQKPKDSIRNVLHFTNEIALAKTTYGNAILLSGLDKDLLKENLITANPIETYKDVEFYTFDNPEFFSERLAPFIAFENATYFFVLDAFVVFANTTETLKSILSDKLNNNVLSDSPKFQTLLNSMADESSYFIFNNGNLLSEKTGQNTYNAAAVQFNYDTDFAHINGNYINYTKPAAKNSITESFSVSLPKALISEPKTVKNHITKRHDIIAQDVDHTLYLISDSGAILWKRKLDAPILGKVEQIDTYKNGRLQLAFATKNNVYVIDRNGKDVGNFPKRFNDDITQPLSVFDYDKTKNYRLLVTQGKSLLMYDAKGERVTGFKHKTTKNTIDTQPKHFRVARKDYIVYAQGNTLDIISRQGNIRVPVNASIRFSNNAIYLYQNTFTTTNTLGELVQVDTKGKVNRKALQLTDKHNIATTSKTLVTLSDNKLGIRSRTLNLDFGDYTPPKIFYLNDKIYVSVTDKQAKKVYLFDSQAKPIANFPIFGITGAELQKLDSDRALELITQSDAQTITVYKLN